MKEVQQRYLSVCHFTRFSRFILSRYTHDHARMCINVTTHARQVAALHLAESYRRNAPFSKLPITHAPSKFVADDTHEAETKTTANCDSDDA